ncbi:MAG: glycine--tRNA ligase subunit beta [Candidatus Scalindua sp.]|jgi:glycyl-tRNA synthetase beta chain|nr:glycine--tRNA ligase subunit beta [Candidatus Scalindua sp.]MBT6564278.1 glycine--tRNA ligase subunit beta [Candidatus Scalindua sp.]MBT7212945.1 glycine--tRNA ligase subunit beta [Candidatus Scalindua sp.]MBT7589974.1 glycine--tRNA ligase subunit beta [Candidatus Scalindua sp.]
MSNLLLEIGTEEIPAGYIVPALKQMKELFEEQVKKNRLSIDSIHTTGTPRRLVLFASGLPQNQEDIVQEVKGPSAKVAFDQSGAPTKAAVGFASSQGVKAEEMIVKDTSKGKYCFAVKEIEGKKIFDLLPEMLTSVITSINFPKSMRWKSDKLYFARPIRTIMALFDKDVVNLELSGLKADRKTSGHQFLSDNVLDILDADFELYKEQLKGEKVIVEIDERRDIIRKEINSLLSAYGTTLDEEELLEEVTNLVEFPGAVKCSFDEEFLAIPSEVIETSMKDHQRYFPVKDKTGKLLPEFIVITDREPGNGEIIRNGNERVLRARLADANFFWEEDKKTTLHDRLKDLEGVVFHEDMGSYLDRGERIGDLAYFIAETLDLSPDRLELVKRASSLCKTDLLTEMVGEFPKLQGIMGREYALVQGEDEEVARSIAEHYLPRFADDVLPETEIGIILSLADKFDLIAGCFAAGLIPTGSQDPYGLRRQSQGIIRILETKDLHLSLQKLFEKSLSNVTGICPDGDSGKVYEQIIDFFKDRINNIYIDRGYRYDIVESVMKSGFNDISDLICRLEAITKISKTPIWQNLVAVVERTFNIGKNCESDGEVKEDLLEEEEERKLWAVYKKEKENLLKHVTPRRYEELSIEYNEAFAKPIHDFFEKVFVNVEDENIKNNRLLLVKKVNELYVKNIANLAFIVEHDR